MTTPTITEFAAPPPSPWRMFWTRLRRNPAAFTGFCILVLLIITSLAAPLLAHYDYTKVTLADRFLHPMTHGKDGGLHILGTDAYGRDVVARMIYGGRVTMAVGVVAAGISLCIGVVLGSLAGFYGGWVDNIIMRACDMMLSIPLLVLNITVLAFLGPSIGLIMLVIGCTTWAGAARLVRGEFLSLKERDFVEAARAMGARDLRMIFGHILPNTIAALTVRATLSVASAILTEASLSFLGIGIPAPAPSWGSMLFDNTLYLRNAWWASTFPGAAIFVTLLSLYLLGDGLLDALDPRMKGA